MVYLSSAAAVASTTPCLTTFASPFLWCIIIFHASLVKLVEVRKNTSTPKNNRLYSPKLFHTRVFDIA